jgi:hypothetical protein
VAHGWRAHRGWAGGGARGGWSVSGARRGRGASVEGRGGGAAAGDGELGNENRSRATMLSPGGLYRIFSLVTGPWLCPILNWPLHNLVPGKPTVRY